MATFLIIFGAHVNTLFIIKVKDFVLSNIILVIPIMLTI